MNRNTNRALAAVCFAALLAGCGSLTFPDTDATIQGDVVGIGDAIPFGSVRSIWVKETPEAPCGIVFRIDDDTDIGERVSGGDVEERAFEDLALGQVLRVWSGAVAESCPGQATAEVIEILAAG